MNNKAAEANGSKLGTFAGVFTPSILTILGIILFLRLGYVVGEAGLWKVLLIIGLANAISVLTSVSLSAVATNMKVKGGGDYYLISRTLGLEFGGAIGLVLFLAQSVSVAFYCIGFGEALESMLPGGSALSPRMIALIAMALLFVFAWLGADVATKFQFVVMALLVLALASFFIGGLPHVKGSTLAQNWTGPSNGPGFWILFAIFFPAVTGFTQGVSMSGDLKDPIKSLPRGTFAAVFLSIAVYFGAALIFAATSSLDVLSKDYSAMQKVAKWPVLIDAGVVAATLSSAMASFLGAPRILQSLAQDKIFPFLTPFAKGEGASANPRRGVLLAAGIALVTILMGNLNLIAPVVSMFFLISYGLLNYATYFEAKAASPSFRPTFKYFNKKYSLLGFLACLGAMLAIDPKSGAAAIAVLFAIHQYLMRTAHTERWADGQRSHHLQEMRKHLLATVNEPEHYRDWRPYILVFTERPDRRANLLRFSSWLEGKSGAVTAIQVIEQSGAKGYKMKQEAEEELRQAIAEQKLPIFPLAIRTSDVQTSLETLLQCFGIGPFKANTAVLNWFEEKRYSTVGGREIPYSRNLRIAFRAGVNIVLLAAGEEEWAALDAAPKEERRIDVWWKDDATGRLMLLLAYLITRNSGWENAKIRVLVQASEEDEKEAVMIMADFLQDARIKAEPVVLSKVDPQAVREESGDAALVFSPFRLHYNQLQNQFGGKIEDLLNKLPIVALVLASHDVDLTAQPDEGEAGKLAAAMDEYEECLKKAQGLEHEAEMAREEALKAEKRLLDAPTGDSDQEAEKRAAMVKQAQEARDEAAKVFKKSAKAEARLQEAAKIMESLGLTTKAPRAEKNQSEAPAEDSESNEASENENIEPEE
ncbi:amino acid permease [Desulfatibacillum aliphaticivorans]|uniref:amino acid permease n=1 Tax=Desulfatibacillum aliphaticivorans TaxID=218208 RepID=UPI0004277D98|nr:amino acid permease [Desulfatibacillum aliphaticivorans]